MTLNSRQERPATIGTTDPQRSVGSDFLVDAFHERLESYDARSREADASLQRWKLAASKMVAQLEPQPTKERLTEKSDDW